jgi:hypothetical protein
MKRGKRQQAPLRKFQIRRVVERQAKSIGEAQGVAPSMRVGVGIDQNIKLGEIQQRTAY